MGWTRLSRENKEPQAGQRGAGDGRRLRLDKWELRKSCSHRQDKGDHRKACGH